jgi:hypothetical protein
MKIRIVNEWNNGIGGSYDDLDDAEMSLGFAPRSLTIIDGLVHQPATGRNVGVLCE